MTRSSHLAVHATGLVKTFGTTRAVDGIDLDHRGRTAELLDAFSLTFGAPAPQ
jgi:hypothetical protein